MVEVVKRVRLSISSISHVTEIYNPANMFTKKTFVEEVPGADTNMACSYHAGDFSARDAMSRFHFCFVVRWKEYSYKRLGQGTKGVL